MQDPSVSNDDQVPANDSSQSLVERAYQLKARTANTPDHPPGQQSEQNTALVPAKRKIRWSRIISAFLSVAIFSMLYWQRQNIIDWWWLRSYTPSVDATRLATETTMTNLGRKIFYLQEPKLQDKATFYKSCDDGETIVVLGCYKPKRTLDCAQVTLWTKIIGCTNDSRGIFVLKVSDERLQGVEQVTAAHEMLHAAYDRLSYVEQKRINDLVMNAYQSLDDPNVESKIQQYQNKGADIANELHSILGSEVAHLPAELETYYKQYFSDRSTITKYANAFQNEFRTRKARVEAFDAQLEELEAQIVANNQKIDAQYSAVQVENRRLESLLGQGRIEEYNAGVPAYNQSLTPLRQLISQTKKLVAEYRSILTERNRVAGEAQELEKVLDSRIVPKVEDI